MELLYNRRGSGTAASAPGARHGSGRFTQNSAIDWNPCVGVLQAATGEGAFFQGHGRSLTVAARIEGFPFVHFRVAHPYKDSGCFTMTLTDPNQVTVESKL